jgi:hypothetical protein
MKTNIIIEKGRAARVALWRLVGLLKSEPFFDVKSEDGNSDTNNHAKHNLSDGLVVPIVSGVLGALVVLSFF